jgi:pimeloyl-ACP methyl ester carboxylesterase
VSNLQAATATSQFVEANGIKLHYLDYGRAGRRAMVCVHGGAAHAHWFDFVAPGLNNDHHVLSLDLRGHGDSAWAEQHTYAWHTYAADLNAFVEKLDLTDFVLIGHSMGGMVSLLYSATYPARMGRLVVVDSIMLMPMERVTRMRAYGGQPPRAYETQEDLVARYRLEGAEKIIAAPEVLRRMAVHSGKQDADGKWRHKADRRVYANFSQIAGVPLWEKVRIPALVVRGGEDSKRFTPDTVAEVRMRAPQVQVTAVPQSDHHVTLDNPRGFVEVVRKFLAS